MREKRIATSCWFSNFISGSGSFISLEELKRGGGMLVFLSLVVIPLQPLMLSSEITFFECFSFTAVCFTSSWMAAPSLFYNLSWCASASTIFLWISSVSHCSSSSFLLKSLSCAFILERASYISCFMLSRKVFSSRIRFNIELNRFLTWFSVRPWISLAI